LDIDRGGCMKSVKKNIKQPRRIVPQKETLTKDKFIPIFEDIKVLIKSTAKGTETVLKKEMDEKFKITWAAISEHTRLIKGLDARIEGMDAKIDGVRNELTGKIEDVRTDLKGEMHQMERRLAEKIDKNSEKLEGHEERISILESNR